MIFPDCNLSDPNHLFSLHLHALELSTMWPLKSGKFVSTIFKIVLLWNSIVLSIHTVLLLVKAIQTDDLVDRSEAMDIFTLTGSANYKMLFFFFHHEKLVETVKYGIALTPHLPTGWTKNCNFFSKFYWLAGVFTMSFWAFCPLLKWTFGESTWEEMAYPMNIYDPFDSTGFLYLFIYLTCHYGLVLSGMIYMAADCYFFTSIYVANGALQTVHDKLNYLQTNIGRNELSSHDEARKYLKDCIELHVYVLEYIRITDKLFRSMIMVDVLHAIISLSFAMLQTSESKGIMENLKMVIFVATCFIHQFLNSHFGQNLIDKQTTVSDKVIVSIPWTEGDRTFKKMYSLMISGTRKVRKLSAWSVYELQYGTFLEFVKSMISYYMVLRQLQNEVDAVK